MSITDWHGREIKVGDVVQHAYEPLPPDQRSGLGYHLHGFAGTATVAEICGRVVILGRTVFGSNIFLGSLLEVVSGDKQRGGTLFPWLAPTANPIAAEGGLTS